MKGLIMKTLNLKIADYQCYTIATGLFGLDGGAMFGTVPKVLWEKNHPTDDLNRIQMEARALLLVSSDKKILIDTGNGSDFISKYGEKLGGKFSEMYGVNNSGTSLMNSLSKLKITPDQITHVILTHLHFDHAGGATKSLNDQIVPTFPKAQYFVQRANYENAIHPNKREKASYLAANFEPLMTAGKLTLLNGTEKEILPNIHFYISNGHTAGHQCIIIEDANTRLVYCGDVIPTSSHVRSAWVMGYDLNPLLIMNEKEQLLKLAENKTTYYFFEHDPTCELATVTPNKGDYQVNERYVLTK